MLLPIKSIMLSVTNSKYNIQILLFLFYYYIGCLGEFYI